MSEGAVAPSDTQVRSSLRSIAARLGADDMTVNYRYKRLMESRALSTWQLIVNPTFFDCRMLDATADVEPESAKPDMIRKLKLVTRFTGMIDFYGRALKLIVVYNGEESRSRIIELISRITNTERMTQVNWPLPRCRTEHMSETDVTIIRALKRCARASWSWQRNSASQRGP